MATKETWRPCPSLPDFEASDQGHIRNMETGKVIKPFMHEGILTVFIYWLGGRTLRRARSLVYEAFHGKQPKVMRIVCVNGDESDVRLSNLTARDTREYASSMRDYSLTGRIRCEDRPLTTKEIDDIVWAYTLAKRRGG